MVIIINIYPVDCATTLHGLQLGHFLHVLTKYSVAPLVLLLAAVILVVDGHKAVECGQAGMESLPHQLSRGTKQLVLHHSLHLLHKPTAYHLRLLHHRLQDGVARGKPDQAKQRCKPPHMWAKATAQLALLCIMSIMQQSKDIYLNVLF